MRIAVTGKGGVGKTTLVASLAREAAARGERVVAVDADPDANLASTLGMESPRIPLSEAKELIAERAGSVGMVRMNPRVDDILDRYGVLDGGICLLVLEGIRQGGAGCACPANALLRELIAHLLTTNHTVFLDMEAGIEHLGRGTVAAVDALLVVVNRDLRSLRTAARIVRLGNDIGVRRVVAVANRLVKAEDEEAVCRGLPEAASWLGTVPYTESLRGAVDSAAVPRNARLPAVRQIMDRLESSLLST